MMNAGLFSQFPVYGIKCIDLHRHLLQGFGAALCERGHAPIRDGEDDASVRVTISIDNCLVKQETKLLTVFWNIPSAALIVDSDEQRNEVVWRLGVDRLDTLPEFICRPAVRAIISTSTLPPWAFNNPASCTGKRSLSGTLSPIVYESPRAR
jgi:hypothetical protein